MSTTRPRVVVAGLGDTGVLSAIGLARHADVLAVSTKPGLVSGQELGLRLARPEEWQRDYRISHRRFRGLDRVEVVHGAVTGADLDARTVTLAPAGGGPARTEAYDVLVVATGVTNGFWRRPEVQDDADVDADLREAHDRLAGVARHGGTLAVVGGGAAAVSSAAQAARTWPDLRVDLYHPGERPLPHHHGRTRAAVARRLDRLGVRVHPGHRAVLPDDLLTGPPLPPGPVGFSTGQPDAGADAVLWAVGRVVPHTAWLPEDVLDEQGFVAVDATMRVPHRPEVLAVGDVAATDPLRTSARNAGHRVLVHNVRAHLEGGSTKRYRAARRRWGSVLGPQPDGLTVHAPGGRAFRVPARVVDGFLQPVVVRRGIYGGVRREGR